MSAGAGLASRLTSPGTGGRRCGVAWVCFVGSSGAWASGWEIRDMKSRLAMEAVEFVGHGGSWIRRSRV